MASTICLSSSHTKIVCIIFSPFTGFIDLSPGEWTYVIIAYVNSIQQKRPRRNQQGLF